MKSEGWKRGKKEEKERERKRRKRRRCLIAAREKDGCEYGQLTAFFFLAGEKKKKKIFFPH